MTIDKGELSRIQNKMFEGGSEQPNRVRIFIVKYIKRENH